MSMQPIQENEEAAGCGIAQRRFLIAVDDSAESERALSWTLEEIYRSAMNLLLPRDSTKHLVFLEVLFMSCTKSFHDEGLSVHLEGTRWTCCLVAGKGTSCTSST